MYMCPCRDMIAVECLMMASIEGPKHVGVIDE